MKDSIVSVNEGKLPYGKFVSIAAMLPGVPDRGYLKTAKV